MQQQNPNTYTTPLKDCFKDIDQIVKDTYERDYQLSSTKRDLTVTFAEIDAIIKSCPEKNQKLIAYAMLIHAKRFANEQGVFYMSRFQLAKATGLGEATIPRQIDKLEQLNVIEVVERDRKVKGEKHKPNLYRITLSIEKVEDNEVSMSEIIPFSSIIKHFYDDGQLKKLLPRRQFEQLVKVG